ncbi:unnamed protein product [Arctogadus glacialis]
MGIEAAGTDIEQSGKGPSLAVDDSEAGKQQRPRGEVAWSPRRGGEPTSHQRKGMLYFPTRCAKGTGCTKGTVVSKSVIVLIAVAVL